MKAVFVMANFEFVEDFLFDNDIEYKIWSSKNENEFEIRVDVGSLNENQIEKINDKFIENDELSKYDYIIFWE